MGSALLALIGRRNDAESHIIYSQILWCQRRTLFLMFVFCHFPHSVHIPSPFAIGSFSWVWLSWAVILAKMYWITFYIKTTPGFYTCRLLLRVMFPIIDCQLWSPHASLFSSNVWFRDFGGDLFALCSLYILTVWLACNKYYWLKRTCVRLCLGMSYVNYSYSNTSE